MDADDVHEWEEMPQSKFHRPSRSFRTSWIAWLAPVAALVLIALGYVWFMPDDEDGHAATVGENPLLSMPASMLPAPGPVDASVSRDKRDLLAIGTGQLDTEGHPVLRPRRAVSASHHPALELPIQSGRASFSWLRDAILHDQRLPSMNAVRTEEILNHFRMRPIGSTAIFKGVTLSVECIPCPRDMRSRLAVVALRGARDQIHEVSLVWNADVETVWRYRLIGYSPVVGMQHRRMPRTLNAAAEHVVVLEIEPSSSAAQGFGMIEWTIQGEPAPSLSVTANPRRIASVDARYAAFVCVASEWLYDPAAARKDHRELVAKLLEEVEADPPFPKRIEFNQIIRKALVLAAPPEE